MTAHFEDVRAGFNGTKLAVSFKYTGDPTNTDDLGIPPTFQICAPDPGSSTIPSGTSIPLYGRTALTAVDGAENYYYIKGDYTGHASTLRIYAGAGPINSGRIDTIDGRTSGFMPKRGPSPTVTITKITPKKVACAKPGQATPSKPTVTVAGSGFTSVTTGDEDYDWVLYTNESFTTTIGSEEDSGNSALLRGTSSDTSITLTTPEMPGGAIVNSQGLTGPWRLKLTYTNTEGHSKTVFSDAYYFTAIGDIYISSAAPQPVHDGATLTIVGPGIGNACHTALFVIGGNTLSAAMTKTGADSATCVVPQFGYPVDSGGDLTCNYTLNGNVLSTNSVEILYATATDVVYVPPPIINPQGNVPPGPMKYPANVQRWIFLDPYTGDTYTVPRNPDAMTSPFPTRTINTKFTTAVDGQMLLTEGSPTPATWQFSGTIKDAAHYDALRSWVYDRNRRVQITDHFGRVITCVLTQFNPGPKVDKRNYWSHTYQINATVISVTEPTQVPS